MIRLFVTDLDGCISHPFHPPAWEAISEIVRLHANRDQDPRIPSLTVCTGRPQAYAEAVAQWMSVTNPFLFESGSGMYDPTSNRVWWSPRITAATERALTDLRRTIHEDLVPQYPGTMAEFGKQKDVGLTNPDPRAIEAMHRIVCELVTQLSEGDLEVHFTEVSVNVIPRAANKGAGLTWLSEHTGIGLDEMAYIGDSQGDLSALTTVGRAFAPRNATPAVKTAADVVTLGEATAGVLEAYRMVIEENHG